jgi:hypothetical protein
MLLTCLKETPRVDTYYMAENARERTTRHAARQPAHSSWPPSRVTKEDIAKLRRWKQHVNDRQLVILDDSYALYKLFCQQRRIKAPVNKAAAPTPGTMLDEMREETDPKNVPEVDIAFLTGWATIVQTNADERDVRLAEVSVP